MVTTNSGERKKAGSICFGFYPRPLDINNKHFSIITLPSCEDDVKTVLSDTDIVNDWIYSGRAVVKNFINGAVQEMPYNARVFGLPKTHMLTLHNSNNNEELDFIVWCLSFFTGMRLTTTDAGFVDATPIKPGKLIDFLLVGCTLEDAIELAISYMQSERGQPRALKRLAAVIHALFLAQYPHALSFERFQYLYMALDSCFKLLSAKAKEPKKIERVHAKRIEWMCETFSMPIPEWAKMNENEEGKKTSQIATARNDTLHEALFFDEPLGFSVYGGNVSGNYQGSTMLQMQALICRLVVAILGAPTLSYVTSKVDTRGKVSLRLV